MNDAYEQARRFFEIAYDNVIHEEQPTVEDARRKRAEIITRMQVQAVAKRVPDVLRPILNGRAAAYAAIIEGTRP